MSLEKQLQQHMEQWEEHYESVKYSSNTDDYIDCEAYQNLVNQGVKTLVFIERNYRNFDESNPLCLCIAPLVRDIMGEEAFEIPLMMQGKVRAMYNYSLNWIKRNIQ
jgi:hypothetical protein